MSDSQSVEVEEVVSLSTNEENSLTSPVADGKMNEDKLDLEAVVTDGTVATVVAAFPGLEVEGGDGDGEHHSNGNSKVIAPSKEIIGELIFGSFVVSVPWVIEFRCSVIPRVEHLLVVFTLVTFSA